MVVKMKKKFRIALIGEKSYMAIDDIIIIIEKCLENGRNLEYVKKQLKKYLEMG
jgi:hypothetical protein